MIQRAPPIYNSDPAETTRIELAISINERDERDELDSNTVCQIAANSAKGQHRNFKHRKS